MCCQRETNLVHFDCERGGLTMSFDRHFEAEGKLTRLVSLLDAEGAILLIEPMYRKWPFQILKSEWRRSYIRQTSLSGSIRFGQVSLPLNLARFDG